MSNDAYKEAGVDIDKGNEAVKKIRSMVHKMGVNEIGKFSGFFPLQGDLKKPILVSSADGVGTKLKIAFMCNVHNTVGHDLVNHCVDDILVYGARPLFFLDYFATGKLEPDVVSSVVNGILDGCLENEFQLLGGETAEMPGFYQEKEYDLAGFIVGVVEKENVVDGKKISSGDLIVGLPSTGLHTNGFSLARHIIFEQLKLNVNSKIPELEGTIGEELLKIHKSYLKPVQGLLKKKYIKGMAHITGGGFIENIPRILPDGLMAQIERVWPIPEIFQFLVNKGDVSLDERYRVFNMGIGMVLIIDKTKLSAVEKILTELEEPFYLIGQVVEQKGKERVKIN